MPRAFPRALPHGPIREVLPDTFFVTGSVGMPGPVPVRFSRNMTVLREGDRLVLVNTVRLDEAGLAALDALGRVTDVVRLAGFHGMDDPFYADRYGAKVWAVRGQRYTEGWGSTTETYFTPHVEMDAGTNLPIAGARLHVFGGSRPEALLIADRAGGVAIAGDSLQHWAVPDEFFNWPGRAMMRPLGFLKPHNVGPGWLKRSKPPPEHLRAVLSLPFENVLPSHGAPTIGGAREAYRPAIERATR
jgi:hypothetical protein